MSLLLNGQQPGTKTKYSSVIDYFCNIPGIVVGPDAGPGVMPNIYIRGIGTNSGNTTPLFLVDDIRTDNLMYLNPDDIYSVEVIKDATAAFYGMESLNGVIVIRTKSVVKATEDQQREKADARKAARAARQAARKAH